VSLFVSDLCKHFGNSTERITVLRGVSFELETGDSLAITGPSGSGKSTLLHCLGTLTAPSSGSIRINETNPFELAEPELARFRNEIVGFVFQDHHLLPQYSALENTMMPALAFPAKDPDVEARARHLLERVGLNHRLDRYPGTLSGGERQRVAVARALMNYPSLLLCDEPTGNLDHETAETISDLLFELHKEERTMMIAVTHSLELAAKFKQCQELREGRLLDAA
jgi:lipoprotein-releasing system ATP-binding protein